MKNYVYIAVSLDGYIADVDGGLEWLDEIAAEAQEGNQEPDTGWTDFMSKIDALLMGRNTYEKVLTFGMWPYEKPVFVLTGTLKTISEDMAGKAEIVSGDLRGIIKTLNNRGYKNLYIDGGKVIQGFLHEDLIDELIITRIPIVLGGGIPLFGKLKEPLRFKHTKTSVIGKQMVQSFYTRKRENTGELL